MTGPGGRSIEHSWGASAMTGWRRRRLRRRAGAAAALGAALLVVAPTPSAFAAATITVDTPADGKTLDSSAVTVKGQARSSSSLATLRGVILKVGDKSLALPSCDGLMSCDLSWSPALAANGPYELTVSATEATLGVIGGTTSTFSRKFVVDAPPAAPVVGVPRITDARTVELTWSRNSEPDMLYYAVFRKDPAGSAFLPVGRIDQPKEAGKSISFTDATTTITGGDYAYQVVAVRKGGARPGEIKPETASTPSSARTASVPLPPTTTTAAPAPGAPAAPGQGSATTVKPGAAAGVDLSGFLASRDRPAPTPPPTILEPPDAGFKTTLPFDPAAPGQDQEEGDADAVAPPSTGRSSPVVSLDNTRPLVPVAGGLILLLLAIHIRLLNRRLKPAATGDLPIETATPAMAPPPERTRPAPVSAPGPPMSSIPLPDREPEPEPNPGPEPEADALWERGPEPLPGPETEVIPVADMGPEPEPETGDVDPIDDGTDHEGRATTFYDVSHDEGWPSGWERVAEASPSPADQRRPVRPPPEVDGPERDEDFDDIEIEEVISPIRRPLVRSGSR